jgi:hypothetical protein
LGHDEGYRPGLYFADGFLRRRATVGLLQRRVTGHARASRTVAVRIEQLRVQPAAIADAKEPNSFFTCKITC